MLDITVSSLAIDQSVIKYIEDLESQIGWIVAILLLAYVLFYPEKFEKLSAFLYKTLYGALSMVYKKIPWLKKKYIEHDFQSNVNNFNNNFLKKEIKGFPGIKIKVDWIDEKSISDSFLKEGELVVRMRKDDNDNKNFVNATMVFISKCVLTKAKVYISKKQRESIDLFIAKKMFDRKNEEVVLEFIENYLQPRMEDKKIDNLFDKYDNIDRAGLFFPVFIQEMIFLGEKVFNQKKGSSKNIVGKS